MITMITTIIIVIIILIAAIINITTTIIFIVPVKFSAAAERADGGKREKGRCSQLRSCFDRISTLCNYFYAFIQLF